MDRVKNGADDSPATAEIENVGSVATGERDHFGGAEPVTQTQGAGGGGGEQSGFTEYLRILWRRKFIVIAVLVVAVGGVLAYCELTSKSYTAQATVLLEPPVSTLFNQSSSAQPTGLVNVQDVIQVMQSSSISDIVSRTIPNPPSVGVAQVGTLATTDVVHVSSSSGDPHVAAAAANAYANAYISFERNIDKEAYNGAAAQISNKVATVQLAISNLDNSIRSSPAGVNQTANEVQLGDLENQLTALQDQLQTYQFAATQGTNTEVGRVISLASVPTSPSSPHTVEYVIFAIIGGLIVGIGLAFLVNAVSSKRI
jgi:uncharacterized protein involved in exopolysaccharide biosynthesis